jgi:DNA-binding MarR family transcriptional regulator
MELGLNSNEMLFCAVLMSFHNDDKTLRAGFDNIQEALPISKNTLRRTLESLRKKGLINVASGSKERNANTYYPTEKLKACYAQNGPINMPKMGTHTPSKEGYIIEKSSEMLSEHLEGFHKVAKNHGFLKEFQQDLQQYPEQYAIDRLQQRIDIKEKKTQ